MKFITCFVLVVSIVHSVKLPHTFRKCQRSQPDLKKCLKQAVEHNIHLLVHPYKDLHLPGLKPLQLPSLVIGSGKRAVAVEQNFSDCNLYGFDHGHFNVFEFDFERKQILMDVVFSEITKKCRYQLNGKVLLLPVQGEGESTVILKNVTLVGSLPYEEVKKANMTYLHFTRHSLKLDTGHVYFHFDNLFNGDGILGDTVNKLLNDNWKEVFEDVREAYNDVLNEILQELLNKFWERVSLEEAFGENEQV